MNCYKEIQRHYLAKVLKPKKHLSENAPAHPAIVLVHGWGASSDVFDELALQLAERFVVHLIDLPGFGHNALCRSDYRDVSEDIAKCLPEFSVLVGWSLGGMLIPSIIKRATKQQKTIMATVSLAANARFVASDTYETALTPANFEQFVVKYQANAAALLKRFATLQSMGDKQARQVKQALNALAPSFLQTQNYQHCKAYHAWHKALLWLQQIDNRDALKQINVPMWHILGEHDTLVPVICADFFNRLPENHRVTVLEGVSHAPHLSQPTHLAKEIISYVQTARSTQKPHQNNVTVNVQLDKNRISRSFSEAASEYNRVAYFQKKMATQLSALLDEAKGAVVDLGCGTGYCADAIKEKMALHSELYYLDLSIGMLKTARKNHPHAVNAVCADIEHLPFKPNSIDTFISNMSMQWCEDLPRLFTSAYEALRNDGVFLFSTLGPDTLKELKFSWLQADMQFGNNAHRHVNHFYDFKHVEQSAVEAGFKLLRKTHFQDSVKYSSVITLLKELKTLGAHNMNKDQPKGLTGRAHFEKMLQSYNDFRTPAGEFPLSYDMGFYLLSK